MRLHFKRQTINKVLTREDFVDSLVDFVLGPTSHSSAALQETEVPATSGSSEALKNPVVGPTSHSSATLKGAVVPATSGSSVAFKNPVVGITSGSSVVMKGSEEGGPTNSGRLEKGATPHNWLNSSSLNPKLINYKGKKQF